MNQPNYFFNKELCSADSFSFKPAHLFPKINVGDERAISRSPPSLLPLPSSKSSIARSKRSCFCPPRETKQPDARYSRRADICRAKFTD